MLRSVGGWTEYEKGRQVRELVGGFVPCSNTVKRNDNFGKGRRQSSIQKMREIELVPPGEKSEQPHT